MTLRFVNPRRVEPAASGPWLARVELSPVERAQLVNLVRRFDPTLTEDEIFAADASVFARRCSGMSECPIEWWEVADEGGVRYRLWICCADCGYLFDAGSTTQIAPVNRFAFYGEGWEGRSGPESLAERLEAAQREVDKKTELSKIDFVNRPRREG
jgi:hypothetical protein